MATKQARKARPGMMTIPDYFNKFQTILTNI